MTKELLNEREFELINIIGAELSANQRDLSKKLDISLGMTNMLLKRLITKGYIRIQQLNQRKVRYLLTSKGFAEKMHKSLKYTLKTINSIGLIKKRLLEILKVFSDQGERIFYILGESDFAFLIEAALKELGCQAVHVTTLEEAKLDGVLCVCKEDLKYTLQPGQKHIDFIKELAQDQEFTERSLK